MMVMLRIKLARDVACDRALDKRVPSCRYGETPYGQPMETSHSVPLLGALIVTWIIVEVPAYVTSTVCAPETRPPVSKIRLPSYSMKSWSGTSYIWYETGKVPL